MDRLAGARKRRAAVGARAAELQVMAVLAVGRRIALAVPAVAAGTESHHDPIAATQLADPCPHPFDDARALVPEHRGQRAKARRKEVGVAHARRDETHDHFVVTRWRELHVLDRRRHIGTARDGGGNHRHLHRLIVAIFASGVERG